MARVLVLVVAVLLAFIAQRFLPTASYFEDALWLYAAAALLAAWATRPFLRDRNAVAQDNAPPSDGARPAARKWGWGIIVLAAGIALIVSAYQWAARPAGDITVLWLLSIGILVYGAYKADGHRFRIGIPSRRLLLTELLPLAIILALGSGIRLYELGTLPPGSLSDEAVPAWIALRLMHGDPAVDSPFTIAWAHPNISYYAIVAFYQVFGVGIYALRVFAAVKGILSLVAIYLLGRALFSPPAALVATFLVAVATWHLHMSRLGWEGVMEIVLLEALSFFFLWQGLHTRRVLWFVAAGLATGFTLYGYTSGKMAVFIALGFLGLWFLFNRGFADRWFYRGVAMFVLAAAIAFAPLGTFIAKNPNAYLWRTNEVSIWRNAANNHVGILDVYGRNVRLQAEMLVYRDASAPRYGTSNTPWIDFAIAPFFVLGLAYSLLHWRRRENLLLLSWFFLGLQTALLSDGPTPPRAVAAIAPAFLLIAGFWDRAGQAWMASAWRARWKYALVVPALFLAASAYVNVGTYFNHYVYQPLTWWAYQDTDWNVSAAVNTLGEDYEVYLSPAFADSEVVRFATALKPAFKVFRATDISDAKFGERGVAFVMHANNKTELASLQEKYPEGEYTPHHDSQGNPDFYTYVVEQARNSTARSEATSGESQ